MATEVGSLEIQLTKARKNLDEMRQQVQVKPSEEFTDLQNQEIENATEKREKEEQELIDFWGFMTDKVLDK